MRHSLHCYRLTPRDEMAMIDAIRAFKPSNPASWLRPEIARELEIAALRAIGCTHASMREVELTWLRSRIQEGRTWPGAGADLWEGGAA